jgi:hypothetical protein
LTGDSYVGTSNAMVRLNTNGTIEKTNLLLDGAGLNNISGANTISSTNLASNNLLNTSQIYSPNFILGLFLGGTGSAGTMNINSGNVINTGDITPITDNTEDIGTLALSYKDIHIKGDVYKNGVIYGGGGGGNSITGITSVDNGNGDIEINFTGTDYKTNGYLTVDTNGRIQVRPTLTLSNAEYDDIIQRWLNEKTDPNRVVQKVYLPNGVPVGGFNHTIHECILVGIAPTLGTQFYQQTRFIGYIENGTPRTSISAVDIPGNTVFNAVEIYNLASTAHPNNVPNANEKQHIIQHFISDYNIANYPNFTATSFGRVAVLTGSVGNWSESQPFWIQYGVNSNPVNSTGYITTLLGSQNGWTSNPNDVNPPPGYTEIF